MPVNWRDNPELDRFIIEQTQKGVKERLNLRELHKKYIEPVHPEITYNAYEHRLKKLRGESDGNKLKLQPSKVGKVAEWSENIEVIDEDSDERDNLIIKLKSEKDILSGQLKKFAKLKTYQTRIVDAIKDCCNAFPEAPIPKATQFPRRKSVQSVGTLISDLEGGQWISEQEMGGLNIYNFETMKLRLQFFIDTFIRIIKSKMIGYTIKTAHIILLGDMVSGIIHDELRESADLAIMSQVLGIAYVLAQAIRDVSMQFREVYVNCVPGNHGRLDRKPRYSQAWALNFDTLVYEVAGVLLKDQKNVHFSIPRSFFDVFEIEGHKYLACHGEDVRKWIGGLPYYGLDRDRKRWLEILKQRKEEVDCCFYGHFHCPESLPGERIINGSISGGSPFSLKSIREIKAPCQYMFSVHRERGITWEFPIWLPIKPEGQSRYIYTPEEPLITQIQKVMFG